MDDSERVPERGSSVGAARHRFIETELALIRRDIEEVHKALFGESGKTGLVDRVEALAEAAERGRWAFKTILWVGGSAVAVMTALAQTKAAWNAIWGHG